jgi:hypothetical protein
MKTTPFMALYSYFPELRFDIGDNATTTGELTLEVPAARDLVV